MTRTGPPIWSAATFAFIFSLVTLSPAPAMAQDDPNYAYLIPALIVFVLIGAFYVIPSIVAFSRGHPNRWPIAAINIAFGGTVIGWFGALIWAMSAVHRSPTGSNGGESGLNVFVNDPTLIKVLPAESAGPPLPTTQGIDRVAADLLRLKQLHAQNLISQNEFEKLKAGLLSQV